MILAVFFLLALISPLSAFAAIPTTLGWYSIPGTNLRAVCPPNGFGGTGYFFADQCTNVTNAWSGGAFDSTRNRLLIFGGGHTDYFGNEIYAMDLDDLTMTRLTNPGLPLAPGSSCPAGIVSNTQPNSRHTYSGLVYAPNTDKMMVTAGSLACNLGATASNTLTDFWTYSFGAAAWSNVSITNNGPGVPGDLTPANNYNWTTAYDPNKQLVFFRDEFFLYTFNSSTGAIARVSTRINAIFYQSATIDIDRRYYVEIGGGRVNWFNISGSANYPGVESQSISGSCGSVIGKNAPGVAYDTVQRKIVIWGGGNTIGLLDTGTWNCTTVSFAGGPTAHDQGTYGRFAYSRQSGVFVTCNSVDANCMALRLVAPADADFDNRRRASGVIYSNGFDNTTSDIVQNVNLFAACQGAGAFRGALDTTTKTSGSGSLKFSLIGAPCADLTGRWSLENPGWGQTFSQNSTFYVQYRVRFSPEFNSNSKWDSHPKIAILSNGALTCAGIELTLVNRSLSEVAQYYDQCGFGVVGTAGPGGSTHPPDPPFNIQTNNWPACSYPDLDAAHCYTFTSNEWITLLTRVDIGTWNAANSRIQAWVSTESSPAYRQWLDTGPGWVMTCNTDPCSSPPGSTQGYSNITLTNYMTGLSVAGEQNAFSWYDELIVSTQNILAPGAAAIAGATVLKSTLDSLSLIEAALKRGTQWRRPETAAFSEFMVRSSNAAQTLFQSMGDSMGFSESSDPIGPVRGRLRRVIERKLN